jgi:hypothetical protein
MGIHMNAIPSARAQIVEARTYLRPLDDEGTIFETPEQAADRIIGHQRWLWERAKGGMRRVTEVSALPPLKFDDPVGYRVEDGWVMIQLTDAEEAELQELKNLFLDRKLTVAGRTRWLGGTAIAKERESSNFNCSFLEVRSVHDIVDATWLLLQGCGVGFRPVIGTLNGFAQPMEIEVVRSQRGPYEKGPENNVETFDPVTKTWTIKVGDSSSAWAKSAGKLVAGKYHAKKLVLDFSLVRGGGGRLKNYGWISSGDAQIAKAYLAIAQILNGAAGRLLTRIEILDILNWLGTILSSRRSAEIAVLAHGEPEWQDFALAKKDMWTTGRDHRQMSNNSIMFYQKPTKYQLSRIFKMMMDAGGSEPGFINAQAAMKRAPWFKGVNPCCEIMLGDRSFCVAENTPLITRKGLVNIGDAVGEEIEVWNGRRWAAVAPFKTGTADKLLRVTFGDGSYLDVTPEHRFFVADRFSAPNYVEVLAKDLDTHSKYMLHTEPFTIEYTGGESVPHAYTIGFYVGDGYGNHINVYSEKKRKLPLSGNWAADGHQNGKPKWRLSGLPFDWSEATGLRSDLSPVFGWSPDSIISFISGLADADGSNTTSGGIRIYQGSENFVRQLQLLLTKVGIRSSVCFMSSDQTNLGKRNKPIWYVSITDTQKLACHRLVCDRSGFGKKNRHQTIVSVTPLDGTHPSFCFHEPETTKAVFGNSLTGQCNLVETVLPRFNDAVEGLHRAHRLVARANYRQTCVNLDDGVLQRSWHELNEFLRLCGVGVTGVVSWDHWRDPAAWEDLRNIAVNGTHSMADELGLPRAKAVTTVKPSGTQSKALGIVGHEVPEGIHMPIGRFIFNRIRFSAHDPIINKLREANYAIEPDPSDPTGVLAVIPVEFAGIKFDTVQVGDETIEVNNESAIAQLDRYKLLMDNYVDHNASITVSYDPEEVPEIVDWLMANWDTYVGVSFIYRQDATRTAADLGYKYLPQTLVSEKTYRAYADNLLPVNLSENAAAEMLADSMECAGGACPVR